MEFISISMLARSSGHGISADHVQAYARYLLATGQLSSLQELLPDGADESTSRHCCLGEETRPGSDRRSKEESATMESSSFVLGRFNREVSAALPAIPRGG